MVGLGQLDGAGRPRARADASLGLEAGALQRDLAEPPLVHVLQLLLRVRIFRVDLEDDLDRGDPLDELSLVGEEPGRGLVLADRLADLFEAPVAVSQPEPVLNFLRLHLDELLQDLRGLLELGLLQVLGDRVLQFARVEGVLGHGTLFLSLDGRPCLASHLRRPPGCGGPCPCRRAGSAAGRPGIACAFFPA